MFALRDETLGSPLAPRRPGDQTRPEDHHVAHRSSPWGHLLAARNLMGGSCSSGWRGKTRAGPARPCDEERRDRARHTTTHTSSRRRSAAANRLVGLSPPPRYPAHGVIGFPLGFPLDTISRRRPAHVEPGSATPLSPWRPWLDRAERPPGIYKGLKSRGPPAPRIGTLSTADVARHGNRSVATSWERVRGSVTESCTAAATASGDE